MSEIEERLFAIRRATDNLKYLAVGIAEDRLSTGEETKNAIEFVAYSISDQLKAIERLL